MTDDQLDTHADASVRPTGQGAGGGPLRFGGTTVLITGASSGLGEGLAGALAARGADLVLVARRRDRLESLAESLHAAHGIRAEVIEADLAAANAAADLVRTLDERGLRIDSLANVAGFGLGGDFLSQDPERISGLLAVNVVALTGLTRALLPRIVASARGFVLTIASTAAYQPVPRMAVYGASKAYVLSFTEALWAETRGSGVRVLAVSPGPTKTEFFDVAGEGAKPVGGYQTTEQVIDLTMRALERRHGAASVVSGFGNWIGSCIAGIAPRRLVLAIVGAAMR